MCGLEHVQTASRQILADRCYRSTIDAHRDDFFVRDVHVGAPSARLSANLQRACVAGRRKTGQAILLGAEGARQDVATIFHCIGVHHLRRHLHFVQSIRRYCDIVFARRGGFIYATD